MHMVEYQPVQKYMHVVWSKSNQQLGQIVWFVKKIQESVPRQRFARKAQTLQT